MNPCADSHSSTARVANQAAQVEQLESDRRSAEEDAARLLARSQAALERVSRVREELDLARAAVGRLQADYESILERGAADEEALHQLKPEGAQVAPDPGEMAAVRSQWEALRERVTEAQLNEARSAAALDRVERELRTQKSAHAGAVDRSGRLETESEQLRAGLSTDTQDSEGAAGDLDTLFEERTRCERESN